MSSEIPLVSAIMPTRGRPQFAKEAIELFLAQTWPNKELVIIDDEDNLSFREPPTVRQHHLKMYENIRYERLRHRRKVGEKRNIACSRAMGEIIVHWDDDDHYEPERIRDQVERLLHSGLPLTGYNQILFFDGERWMMYGPRKDYILGTSFVYRKSLWERRPFKDVDIGEDLTFQHGIPHTAIAAGEMMWARTHAGNTSKREIRGPLWRVVNPQCA